MGLNPSDSAGVTLHVVDPRSDDATWSMRQYFAELDERFPDGFDAGDTLVVDAHELEPPTGVFIVARAAGEPVGCGGVQTIQVGVGDGDVGEIKRMWVSTEHRGQGLGRRLLAELEEHSRLLGHRTVRLDTNSKLPEAVAMYRRAGYVEIERYNDNPYPDHWFEKQLS